MIQGTTPTLVFYCEEVDLATIKEVIVTLSQSKVQINKTGDSVLVSPEEGTVQTVLTQEETLQLLPCELVLLQLKMMDESNNVIASNIVKVKVEEILNKEVIENGG